MSNMKLEKDEIINYIADTLDIEIAARQWGGATHLPFFLTDGYAFRMVRLDDIDCLFVKPKEEFPTLPALKKHLTKIAEQTDCPLVLEIDTLQARQRSALISARIPFVVNGNQLYLPFIGAALQERYTKRSERSETLSPTAQLALFSYLYQGEREMYANGLAERLGVSAMQVTRAIRQLVALKLVTTRKAGVRIVIAGTEGGSALLHKAKPHLLNPVRRRFYIAKDAMPPNLPFAGLSALAEYTALNPPDVATYAFAGKANELPATDTLVDVDTQTEIEVWRYSPTLLSAREDLPDPLSLYMTLADGDARIELAKNELLAEIWGKDG
jgi:DNA-binding MarR family transcriptional regulator